MSLRFVGDYAPFWCRNHCSLLLPLCVRNLLLRNHKRPSPRLDTGVGYCHQAALVRSCGASFACMVFRMIRHLRCLCLVFQAFRVFQVLQVFRVFRVFQVLRKKRPGCGGESGLGLGLFVIGIIRGWGFRWISTGRAGCSIHTLPSLSRRSRNTRLLLVWLGRGE